MLKVYGSTEARSTKMCYNLHPNFMQNTPTFRDRAEAIETPILMEVRVDQVDRVWKELERQASEGWPHQYYENLLYLNSSDPLTVVANVPATNKRVCTVAGSGDFPQIFINNGATNVDVFDISLLACCMTELKLVALRNLCFNEYTKLFHEFKKGEGGTIVDARLYQALRSQLSDASKRFFDLLTQGPLNSLLWDGKDTRGPTIARSVRSGVPDTFPKYPTFIDETGKCGLRIDDYSTLAEKARRCSVSIRLQDAKKLDFHESEVPDVLYMANIGNNSTDERMKILHKMLRRGAKKVIFSGFREEGSKPVVWDGAEAQIAEGEPTKKVESVQRYKWPMMFGQLLVPGTAWKGEGFTIRFLGLDQRFDLSNLYAIERTSNADVHIALTEKEILQRLQWCIRKGMVLADEKLAT